MKSFTHTLSILSLWFYLLCLMFFFFFVPSALAEVPKYTPLVGIPGVTNSGAQSLGEYINALYLLTISVGALIGVVRISMAGVKYSMDEIVTSKAEAKEDIRGVLLGLAILLIPFIVLKTINPDLVKLNVLDGAPQVELKPSTGGGGGGNATTSQSFIQSLPKPPFDTNGVCDPGPFVPDNSETGSGGSCSLDCRAACSARGGVATTLGGQAGSQCLKIRCSK